MKWSVFVPFGVTELRVFGSLRTVGKADSCRCRMKDALFMGAFFVCFCAHGGDLVHLLTGDVCKSTLVRVKARVRVKFG